MLFLVVVLLLSTVVLAVEVQLAHNITGYDVINGRNYIFSTVELSVDDALTYCHDLSMNLASLETLEEMLAVDDYIYSVLGTQDVKYWTSGLKVVDKWLWSGSGTPFVYEFWEAGQPNEPLYPNQACLYLCAGKHCDNPCNFPWNFICEQKLP